MRHSFLVGCSVLLLPIIASADALRTNFTDVSAGAWYADDVNAAANEGIVSGYTDARGNPTGLFGPGDTVTIGQALKIAIQGSGNKPAMTMGGMYWELPYLDYAFDHQFGLVKGQSNVDYERNATRAEVASLIADAFGVDQITPVGNRYDDVTASTAHAFAIEALSRDGIVSGDTDANGKSLARFRPTDPVNRAETVKMVMLARVKYLNDFAVSSAQTSSVSSFVDPTADWKTYTNDQYSYQIRYPSSATARAIGGTGTGEDIVTIQTQSGSLEVIVPNEGGGESSSETAITFPRTVHVQGKTYTVTGGDQADATGAVSHNFFFIIDSGMRFLISVPKLQSETRSSVNTAVAGFLQIAQTFEVTKK